MQDEYAAGETQELSLSLASGDSAPRGALKGTTAVKPWGFILSEEIPMGKVNNIFKKMFDYLLGLFSNDMGIDLGTATTLVYVKGEGVVLCEPSVVAILRGTSQVLAVGEEAKRMLGRTPGNILAIRPMKDGVIADFEITEAMLRYFIKKVHHRRVLVRPRILIAVPSGITEVEKRAVKDSAERAGAREVFLVEEPMAAAIGVGLPIQEPVGNMIIDIGGGTTEIAVISLAGIVFSKSIRIGGDEMDDAIIEYLKKTYNLMIGERTAEEIKIKIGSAYPLPEELTMEVRGRDLVAGLPKTVSITSEEVRESLQEPVRAILESTKISLERTPPELAGDLIEHGIVLAGGGSQLKGLDKLIAEETGLPVHLSENPNTAVVRGTGKVLNEIRYLKKVTVPIKSEMHS
jgi:rod shape-determining protein MreB